MVCIEFKELIVVERPPDRIDMARLRAAIRGQRKIHLSYQDERARTTQRVIRPIAVSYRVTATEFLDERYPTARSQLRAAWRPEVASGDRLQLARAAAMAE